MMHGYNDFPKDAQRIFESIIQGFNMKVIFQSPTEVILKSNKCVIGLFTEYDYVQLCFKQAEEDKWMFLGPYFEALYPQEKIIMQYPEKHLNRIEQIRFSLNEKLNLVKKYCMPILQGDFSWREKYHC